jgi:general secretion pathway protein G
MVAEADQQKCVCGALLTPNMRYCAECYRPVAGGGQSRAHVETARDVETTRRSDPTIVFVPEAREARLRLARKRKRLSIISAIFVLLIGVGIGIWIGMTHKTTAQHRTIARSEMARRELSMMADALERFKMDVGRYPTSSEGLHGLMVHPTTIKPVNDPQANQWLGPYLDSLPEVDPWGEDYVYEVKGNGQSFRLYSYGQGGESDASHTLEISSSGSPQN